MKPEDLNPENDLEVRITALLLGELTAEEEAEVRAAMAANPELMRLHDRLKAVMGLVRDAVPTTELPAQSIPEPLTLAHERRQELLEVFKGGSPKAKEKKIIKVSFWRRYQKDLLKLAAMVVALFGVSWLMVPKRDEFAMEGEAQPRGLIALGRSIESLFSSDLEYTAAMPPPSSSAAMSTPAAPPSSEFSGLTREDVGGLRYLYSAKASSASAESAPGTFVTNTSTLSLQERQSMSDGVSDYSIAPIALPENLPQVQFSSRASGSGGRSLDRARSSGGDVFYKNESSIVAGAVPIGGPQDAFVPQAQSVGGPNAGTPMEPSRGGTTQGAPRNLRIILPETEMAQIKDLSDKVAAGTPEGEVRFGNNAYEKSGQVAQSGGVRAGGAGVGTTHWGYQQENAFSSGNQGMADNTPEAAAARVKISGAMANPVIADNMISLTVTNGVFLGGDVTGENLAEAMRAGRLFVRSVTNHWASQNQGGVGNFTTPNIATYDTTKDIGGVVPRGTGYATPGQTPSAIAGGSYFADTSFGTLTPGMAGQGAKTRELAAESKPPAPVTQFKKDVKELATAEGQPVELGLELKRGLADGGAAQRVDGERFYRQATPLPAKPMTSPAAGSVPEYKSKDRAESEAAGAKVFFMDLNRNGIFEPTGFVAEPDGTAKGLAQTLPQADMPNLLTTGDRNTVNSPLASPTPEPMAGRQQTELRAKLQTSRESFGLVPKRPALLAGVEADALGRVDGLEDRLSVVDGRTGVRGDQSIAVVRTNGTAGQVIANYATFNAGGTSPDVVVPGSMVMDGNKVPSNDFDNDILLRGPEGAKVQLGDAQKNVWYDNSGVVAFTNHYAGDPQWRGVLQNSQPTQSPDGTALPSSNNKFVGRSAYMVLPEGTTLDIKAMREGLADSPSTATSGSGGGGMGGQLSPLGSSVLPQRMLRVANGTALESETRAKVGQMGRDVDSDFIAGRKANESMLKQDGFNLDVIDLQVTKSLDEVEWAKKETVAMDLKPVEEMTKRRSGEVALRESLQQVEGLMKQSGDRFGVEVDAARPLAEPAPVVAVDLTPRVRMSLMEDAPLQVPDEAAKRQSPEAMRRATSMLAEGLKSEGKAEEMEVLRKETDTLRQLTAEAKGVKSPLAMVTKENVQELAKLQMPNQQASEKVEDWRRAREEYVSQLRSKDQVGAPLDNLQKEINRLSDRRIILEREVTNARAKLEAAAKQPEPADAYQGLAAKKLKESDVWKAQVRVAETEAVQLDAQLEAKMGELRKLTTEGGSKILAAGEPIELFVVEDESLNSVYKIQEDGYVTLPKVGRVQVAGKDLPDAEQAIKEALQVSQLKQATVMVERAEQMAKVKQVVKEEDVPAKKPEPAPPGIPQPEVSTAQNAFSTFSLNVSDVSFKLAAASLEKGLMPEVGSVRTEEFINAFNYHDPEPTGSSRVAFAWERARYPFAHDRDLVRFSVQTAAVGREPGKPLNIVLLLDNSGSMERADRIRIRQECLRVLGSQLQPQDKVSVVAFARTARLWVDGLAGAQAGELPERVGNLTPEGGTNLEEAMNLAYQTAQRHFVPNGVNRVVLLTDGAANLGDVQPESLKKKVVSYRQQGVALDCFGIGWEGYNDDLLEALSRNGDGRYGFVNSPEAATTEFASQLAGALKVAASDVKVQVEWNPKRVTVFRQLGYAKHQLKKEEFRDNKVDAAEIGAAEAGNALYTVQVNPAGEGPLGVVRVRYRVPGTDDYREQEWPLAYDGAAKDMQQASVPLRLAGTASAFSEWLVTSPYAGEVTSEKLIAQMAGVPEAYPADPRPKQLEWMIRQAKSLSGR